MEHVELLLACEALKQALKNPDAVKRYQDSKKDLWSNKK